MAVTRFRLIQRQLKRRNMTWSELATLCGCSETVLQEFAKDSGTVLRPSKLLRLAVALRVKRNVLLGLPPRIRPKLTVLVGLSGLPSQAVRERLDFTNTAPYLSRMLTRPPASAANAEVLPVLAAAGVADAEKACRHAVNVHGRGLHASELLQLLRHVGAVVTPSLWGQHRREHWTAVTRAATSELFLVHWPVVAEESVRLQGLAQALGVVLSASGWTPAATRKFAQELALRLLDASSRDDVSDAIDRSSAEAFVQSSRAAGLGGVLDALQRHQQDIGGRDHSFAAHALGVVVADAYAISGELYRRRVEGEDTGGKSVEG